MSDAQKAPYIEQLVKGAEDQRALEKRLADARAEATNTPTSCDGLLNFFSSPILCFWRMIWAGLGATVLGLSVWILALVGHLFNGLLDITVVKFSTQVYGIVREGVEGAWEVFRDVANIVIIGMFTFIAISIILGNQTYGTKKLVANVLIVAVLINFSLLFSKIIIDASNFTAVTFYTAAAKKAPAAAASSGSFFNQSTTATGIAGAFVDYVGIAGIGDAYGAIQNLQKNGGDGFVPYAFFYGVFSAILILAIAVVLLYGAILLIGRAVLLVFLMMVSSLAFASYLIPKYADSEYGWSGWWNQLLKNALFAPMLLMFLWATLTVAQKLKAAPGGGTLGSLLTNPSASVGIATLVHYGIILGLLYASIKVASSFSTSLAKKISAIPAAAALGATGFAARTVIGGTATRLGATNVVAKWPRALGGGALRTGLFKVSTASFDARGIPGAGKLSGQLGVDMGKPRGEGGYIKSMDDRLAAIKKREAAMAGFIGREKPSDEKIKTDAKTDVEKEEKAIAENDKKNEDSIKNIQSEIVNALKGTPMEVSPDVKNLATAADKLEDVATKEAARSAIESRKIQQVAIQGTPESASAKAESNMSQQRHRIEEAKKEAQQENVVALRKELEKIAGSDPGLAARLEEELKGIETRTAQNATHRARLDQLRPYAADPAKARSDAYIKGLGNKRYLTLWGSNAYSPGIQKDVAKKVSPDDLTKAIGALKEALPKEADGKKTDEALEGIKGALQKQAAATKQAAAGTQQSLDKLTTQVGKGAKEETLKKVAKQTKDLNDH